MARFDQAAQHIRRRPRRPQELSFQPLGGEADEPQLLCDDKNWLVKRDTRSRVRRRLTWTATLRAVLLELFHAVDILRERSRLSPQRTRVRDADFGVARTNGIIRRVAVNVPSP